MRAQEALEEPVRVDAAVLRPGEEELLHAEPIPAEQVLSTLLEVHGEVAPERRRIRVEGRPLPPLALDPEQAHASTSARASTPRASIASVALHVSRSQPRWWKIAPGKTSTPRSARASVTAQSSPTST